MEGRRRAGNRASDKWLVPQIVLALILVCGLAIAVLWLCQPVVGDAGASGPEALNEETSAPGVEAAAQ